MNSTKEFEALVSNRSARSASQDEAARVGEASTLSPTAESATDVQALTPDAPPGPRPEETRPRARGFAAVDRKLLTEIASKGGKAAHSAGTAHEFTSDEARAAGRKGGLATHAKRQKKDTP